jgi:uncharacterized protein YdaU (DUF1376 family)
MNDDFFFRCYVDRFLKGLDRLTEAQTNAYVRIVLLYYRQGGALPDRDDDDARWFAGHLKISVRKWRSVRDELIEAGRIWKDEDGYIRDDACDAELGDRAASRARNQENGRAGGKKRAENAAKTARKPAETRRKTPRKSDEAEAERQEINGIDQAGLGFSAKQLESELELESSSPLLGAHARADPPEKNSGGGERKPDTALSLEELHAACVAAAGPGLAQDAAGLRALEATAPRIAVAIRAGCSLELDILPIIRARTASPRASPINVWAYFERAWVDARDRRKAPPPLAAPERNHDPQHANREGSTEHQSARKDRRQMAGAPKTARGGRGGGSLVAAALRARAGRPGDLGDGQAEADGAADRGPERGEVIDVEFSPVVVAA